MQEERSHSGLEYRVGSQINLGAHPSSTIYSLDSSEPYFLICQMGTMSEPTLRVEGKESII